MAKFKLKNKRKFHSWKQYGSGICKIALKIVTSLGTSTKISIYYNIPNLFKRNSFLKEPVKLFFYT